MAKPNCYECKHRGQLSYTHHSFCKHPSTGMEEGDPLFGLLGLLAKRLPREAPPPDATPLNVVGNQHGISHGWFCWPFNFDPIWLESCDGFEQKEVPAV